MCISPWVYDALKKLEETKLPLKNASYSRFCRKVTVIKHMHSKSGKTWVWKYYFWRLRRRLSSNRCFTVSRCIWDLLKYLLRAEQARSSTFLTQHLNWHDSLLKTVSEYSEHEGKCKDCELNLDMDMLLTFEKCIWGKITQAGKCHAKVHKKCMIDVNNPDESSAYLQLTYRK